LRYQIVLTKGRTKGVKYFLNPKILRDNALSKTDLSAIEPHRLKNLIIEDLSNYPNSSIQESFAVAFSPKALLSTNTATLIFLILPGEISRFLTFLLTS